MGFRDPGMLVVIVNGAVVDCRAAECGTDATSDFRCDLYREYYDLGYGPDEVSIHWEPEVEE